LNQKESLSFLTFAPSYVDYLLTCLKHSRPTTLSKIVGVYHIQYRHSLTGENFKRDILVLENLFYPPYKSSSTIIYDLKGSMRNRLVTQDDSVLLDENFINSSQENPLYVRLHSKWLLMKALYSDTLFLSKHGIVDYSLLLYYNTEELNVHVGIIGMENTKK
ncbi:unnamed protein product, partial [Didymodactylos carnosus]